MQPIQTSPARRSCPFTAELSLADLLMMARAELSEARQRLSASYELLHRDGAIATRLSQMHPLDHGEISFATAPTGLDKSMT